MDEGLRSWASCLGLATQYPSLTLRIASVGVSALMLLAPMFDDAAAPETAMAVARSSSLRAASHSLVRTYRVALLPTNFGLKMKKSAFRPRRLAYFEPWIFKAALMRW